MVLEPPRDVLPDAGAAGLCCSAGGWGAECVPPELAVAEDPCARGEESLLAKSMAVERAGNAAISGVASRNIARKATQKDLSRLITWAGTII